MSAARDIIHGRFCPDPSEDVCVDMTVLLNSVERDAASNETLAVAAVLDAHASELHEALKQEEDMSLLRTERALVEIRAWRAASAVVRARWRANLPADGENPS